MTRDTAPGITRTPDDDLHARARRRVGRKMGFYIHTLVFILVNLGLLAVNAVAGGPRWHAFPLLGWGLGLAIHGVVTLAGLHGEGLRERMVDSEVERLRRRV